MKAARGSRSKRVVGIDGRARARRIERWRLKRAAQSQPCAERDWRMAQLSALYTVLGTGHFSEQEIFEADAALRQPPDSPQAILAFGESRDGPRRR